jgi:hypothetical protein
MSDREAGTPRPEPAAEYEKPAIAWEEDLEARPGLVAACLKSAPLSPCDPGLSS